MPEQDQKNNIQSLEGRLKEYSEKLADSISKVYLASIEKDNEVFLGFLDHLEKLTKKSYSKANNDLDKEIAYQEEVFALLNSNYTSLKKENDSILLDHFNKAKEATFLDIPDEINIEQKRERFYFQKGDSFLLRIVKPFKNAAYRIQKSPDYFVNFTKGLLKKEKSEIPFWSHNIRIKDILSVEIFPKYVEEIIRFEEDRNRLFCKISDELLELDKDREFERYRSEIVNVKKSLEDSVKALKNQNIQHFIEICDRADTIEYSNSKLRESQVLKAQERSRNLIRKHSNHWKNTIYAIFEDWRLNKNLLLIQKKSKRFQIEFGQELSKKLNENVNKELENVRVYITALNSDLEKNRAKKEDLKRFVSSSRYKTSKEFVRIVDTLSDSLLNQSFLGLVDKLEFNVDQLIDEIPESSGLAKNTKYDMPTSSKDMEYFSPKQLITFKALPEFQSNLQSVKTDLTEKIEEEYHKVRGFYEGLDFCLDAAYEMIQEEDSDLNEVFEVINSGISRIKDNRDEIQTEIESNIGLANVQIEAAVDELIKELILLEANENVSDIRLKITKGMAKKRGMDVLVRLRQRFNIILEKGHAVYRLVIKKSLNVNDWVQGKLFLKSSDHQISSEISNFLAESHKLVEKLPVVYRRLYEPKPINELNLFIGRKGELAKLNNAFEDWKQEKYSATIVFGERGSGMSSLINLFSANLKRSNKPTLFNPKRLYSTKEDFAALMKDLEIDPVEYEKIQENSSASISKRVIIIDGLEKLFVRKINGFECVKELLKFILNTDDDIFWVCTCSAHTWNYLNKTINAQDYFDHTIELEDFSYEEISKMILKRNQISGYKVTYESTAIDRKSNKFNKLSNNEQQEFLEERFFKQVNKFAKSNLSLSLIFWIQMTHRIEKNQVFIKNFESANFNFLLSLSEEKVYVLLLVVLQDIMYPKSLAEILDINESEAELILRVLKEDSVLIETESKQYILNPILYRHVVDMLKMKNLLH